jgi:DNA-binding NarL/FixJ family response regulator
MQESRKNRIRIAILDGQRIVREGLRMLIETQQDLEVAAETGINKQALAKIGREQPNVILLDLDLADANIVDYIPDIKAAAGNTKILVLTGSHDPEVHRRALQNGAVGIVLKEAAGEVVLKAIRKIYSGEAWIDHAMAARILTEISRPRQIEKADPEAEKITRLTQREREIVDVLCEGLNNRQIAERLFISEATVRNHLTSILAKLALSDRFELAIYAYRHGLAKPPLPPISE